MLSGGEREHITWEFIKTYFIKFSCNLIIGFTAFDFLIVKTDYKYFDFISRFLSFKVLNFYVFGKWFDNKWEIYFNKLFILFI